MENKLLRRHINRLAHRLALASEDSIRSTLTARATDALLLGCAVTDADLEALSITPADWARATMTDAEQLRWLTSAV